MDSGSADLWVGAEDRRDDVGRTFLLSSSSNFFRYAFVYGNLVETIFLSQKSSSSCNDTKGEWSIRYGSGAVSGQLVQDNIIVAGLKLKRLTFGVARNESDQFTLYVLAIFLRE
jgi:hypothetical protein